MLEYLNMFEDEFVKSVMDKSSRDKKKEISAKKRLLERNKNRIAELDDVFKHIYEDNMKGKLSDERFVKLSDDYEAEQKQLIDETAVIEKELAESEETISNVEYFLNIVRQYTDISELSARVVNDLIDKIVIHAPDKSSGHRTQQVDIHYTAVGVIDIPQHFQELVI